MSNANEWVIYMADLSKIIIDKIEPDRPLVSKLCRSAWAMETSAGQTYKRKAFASYLEAEEVALNYFPLQLYEFNPIDASAKRLIK